MTIQQSQPTAAPLARPWSEQMQSHDDDAPVPRSPEWRQTCRDSGLYLEAQSLTAAIPVELVAVAAGDSVTAPIDTDNDDDLSWWWPSLALALVSLAYFGAVWSMVY